MLSHPDLRRNAEALPGAAAFASDQAVTPTEQSIRSILNAIRRRWVFLITWCAVLMSIATVIIFGIQREYRATALVMLDTRELHYAEMRAVLTGPANAMDSNIARSEVAILGSDGLARRVINDLNLLGRPEFTPQLPRLARWSKAAAVTLRAAAPGALPDLGIARMLEDYAAGFEASPDPTTRLSIAVGVYQRALSISNDGRSYIIAVGFASPDRDLAARIANRHAELYIDDQRRMKNEALRSASTWLDSEVSALSERLRQAERAVQHYREMNSLFVARGDSVAAAQLAETNNHLAEARADLARKEAGLAQARNILSGRDSAAAQSSVTASNTISRLRDQEATAVRKEAEYASLMGDRHPTVVAARNEIAKIRTEIRTESGRIVQGLESDAATARLRVKDLADAVVVLEHKLAEVQRAEAGARDMEREAAALRSLYESLLGRQKQVATQEGIQQADARLVSRAPVPLMPSYPDRKLFMVFALMAALTTGVGGALALERTRRGFGSVEDLRAAVPELRGLGEVPLITRASGRNHLAAQILAEPRSIAAEAIRTLRSNLAIVTPVPGRPPPRVLAVTSALPGDGKTSLALALASSLAGSGLSVLLIEADLRRRSLARRLGLGHPAVGLISVLEGRTSVNDAQLTCAAMRVLVAERDCTHPQDLLNSNRLAELITTAAQSHDYVIIDTPPLGIVADALAVARLAEAAILVVRAEATPADAVFGVLRSLSQASIPLAGVVLNGVDMRASRSVGAYQTRISGNAARHYYRS